LKKRQLLLKNLAEGKEKAKVKRKKFEDEQVSTVSKFQPVCQGETSSPRRGKDAARPSEIYPRLARQKKIDFGQKGESSSLQFTKNRK
jgi:hypothetical protein